MAKEKEEDLRKFFSCWWSKPLDGNFPFKQILCFEGGFKRNMRPPSTVGEVFRCLVSLCKDKEISVMMPLLSTGDQVSVVMILLKNGTNYIIILLHGTNCFIRTLFVAF